MHNIRATGSYIRGTNGTSNGIVPMLRVFNDTGEQGWAGLGFVGSKPCDHDSCLAFVSVPLARAESFVQAASLTPASCALPCPAARYVDQGGGKRKGAFAMYCEPWHADIFDWL